MPELELLSDINLALQFSTPAEPSGVFKKLPSHRLNQRPINQETGYKHLCLLKRSPHFTQEDRKPRKWLSTDHCQCDTAASAQHFKYQSILGTDSVSQGQGPFQPTRLIGLFSIPLPSPLPGRQDKPLKGLCDRQRWARWMGNIAVGRNQGATHRCLNAHALAQLPDIQRMLLSQKESTSSHWLFPTKHHRLRGALSSASAPAQVRGLQNIK